MYAFLRQKMDEVNKIRFLLHLNTVSPNIHLVGLVADNFKELMKILVLNRIQFQPLTPTFDDDLLSAIDENGTFMIIGEYACLKELDLHESLNLVIRAIEVGVATELLNSEGLVLPQIDLIFSTILLTTSPLYIVAPTDVVSKASKIIRSNCGTVSTKLKKGDTIVIASKRGFVDKQQVKLILDVFGKTGKYKIYKYPWFAELDGPQKADTQALNSKANLRIRLFEPFVFFIPNLKLVSPNLLREARERGAITTVVPGSGVITILDKDISIKRDHKDVLSSLGGLVLTPGWIASCIANNKLQQIAGFEVVINRSRYAVGIDMTGVKASFKNIPVPEVKRLTAIISQLGGDVVKSSFNYLIVPKVIARRELSAVSSDIPIEHITPSCVDRFKNDMLPHECGYSCHPLVISEDTNKIFLRNGKPGCVRFLLPKDDRLYLESIITHLGGRAWTSNSKADFFIVKPDAPIDNVELDSSRTYSSKFFDELFFKRSVPDLKLHKIGHPEFVQLTQARSSVGEALNYDGTFAGSGSSGLGTEVCQLPKLPTPDIVQEENKEHFKIPEWAPVSNYYKAIVIRKLIEFLGVFGMIHGSFEYDYSAAPVIDVRQTLSVKTSGVCAVTSSRLNISSDSLPLNNIVIGMRGFDDAEIGSIVGDVLDLLRKLTGRLRIASEIVRVTEEFGTLYILNSVKIGNRSTVIGSVVHLQLGGLSGLLKGYVLQSKLIQLHVVFVCVNHTGTECSCNVLFRAILSWKEIRACVLTETEFLQSATMENFPIIGRIQNNVINFSIASMMEVDLTDITEDLMSAALKRVTDQLEGDVTPVPVTCHNCSDMFATLSGYIMGTNSKCIACGKPATKIICDLDRFATDIARARPIPLESIFEDAPDIDYGIDMLEAIKFFALQRDGLSIMSHLKVKLKEKFFTSSRGHTLFLQETLETVGLIAVDKPTDYNCYVLCKNCSNGILYQKKKYICSTCDC